MRHHHWQRELRSVVVGIGRCGRDDLSGRDRYGGDEGERHRAIAIGLYRGRTEELLAFAETGRIEAGIREELQGEGGIGRALQGSQDHRFGTCRDGPRQLRRHLVEVAVVDQFNAQVTTGIDQVAEDGVAGSGVHE